MGGKRKGRKVTVGYRYFWDIHSGLGRGPVDEIVEIRFDDKTAYVGKPGELTYSQAIFIDKPNLFGGEDTGGEGGIQGRMEILMGEADQKPTQMLINLLKGAYNPAPKAAESGDVPAFTFDEDKKEKKKDPFFSGGKVADGDLSSEDLIPGFRGIVTTVFSGLVSCYNAYPKRPGYRVRRTNKGWRDGSVWYPQKCRIVLRNDNLHISGLDPEQEQNVRQVHAMNPAHILVECATNKSWGGKKEYSDLDLDSFKQAADVLFDEGFGLCFRYNRQSSITDFIQQVLDHIGAVQYDNLATGKLAIKLIRQDYNPASLPLYHYDNGILRVQDDDTSSSENMANQVTVIYRDPVSNKDGKATANNLAAAQVHGVITKTTEYKGLPTFDLAMRVAQRDLEMSAGGLMRLKIVFDMRGSQLKPGDVFRVSLPERQIDSAVFRVGKIDNGNAEGEIVVTCIQDVFGLPATNYTGQQAQSQYIQPSFAVKPISVGRLFELPYHVYPLLFGASELSFVQATDCYVGVAAQSPSPMTINYAMYVDAGGGYSNVGDGSFTPSVTLKEAIEPYQTQLKYSGHYRYLDAATALMIDDEIVKIERVDFATQTITVGRGCADTVPKAHSQGAVAWAYLAAMGVDQTKYAANEQLKAKLLTRTTRETLSFDAAPQLNLTTMQRQARPYPPGKVSVNGVLGAPISNRSAFVLRWAHRDRLLQADNLVAHHEDSTQQGQGVSYEVGFWREGVLVRAAVTTADIFRYPDAGYKAGELFDKVTLYSVSGNLKSWQGYQFEVTGGLPKATIPIGTWSYRDTWTAGDNVLNRYNDGAFDRNDGGYVMLSSDMEPTTNLYKSFAIPKGAYKWFEISYKVGTYNQRRGLCNVVIQLCSDGAVIKELTSETHGNYPTDDWHAHFIGDELPPTVNEVRFKVTVPSVPRNNALAFTHIDLKVAQ